MFRYAHLTHSHAGKHRMVTPESTKNLDNLLDFNHFEGRSWFSSSRSICVPIAWLFCWYFEPPRPGLLINGFTQRLILRSRIYRAIERQSLSKRRNYLAFLCLCRMAGESYRKHSVGATLSWDGISAESAVALSALDATSHLEPVLKLQNSRPIRWTSW